MKVHRDLLAAEHIPTADIDERSCGRIATTTSTSSNGTWCRNGTLILKFFLHVSKEEQRQRFLDRIKKPDKHWKFSPDDVRERQFWDEYVEGVRGLPERDEHGLGPLVHHPGRPEMGDAHAGRLDRRARDRQAAPRISASHQRAAESNQRGQTAARAGRRNDPPPADRVLDS